MEEAHLWQQSQGDRWNYANFTVRIAIAEFIANLKGLTLFEENDSN